MLSFNPIMIGNYAAFFNCTLMDRASDSDDGPDIKLFILVGWGQSFLPVAWPIGGLICVFRLPRISVSYSTHRDLYRRTA